jgi:hypothetical protein
LIIPDSCHAWETKMKKDKDSKKILDNLKQDVCIDESVTDNFFTLLAEKGKPESPSKAKKAAFNIVKEHNEHFTLQGATIPEDMFRILFRIESVSALKYLIPDEIKGLSDREIKESPDEELLSLTNQYTGLVDLGNPLKIVWVTDFEEIEPIIDKFDTVCDRLGIIAQENENRYIIYSYDRDNINESLYVPRSLDAIDNPEFSIVEDCDAKTGITKSLNPDNNQGLSEAVHRGCLVTPKTWELKTRQ